MDNCCALDHRLGKPRGFPQPTPPRRLGNTGTFSTLNSSPSGLDTWGHLNPRLPTHHHWRPLCGLRAFCSSVMMVQILLPCIGKACVGPDGFASTAYNAVSEEYNLHVMREVLMFIRFDPRLPWTSRHSHDSTLALPWARGSSGCYFEPPGFQNARILRCFLHRDLNIWLI